MKRPTLLKIIIPVVLVAAGIVYYLFDPTGNPFFVQCSVRQATGYYCPGCGAQRALHDVLHGDILAAIRHNYFLAVAAVGAVAYVLCGLIPRLRPLHRAMHSLPAIVIYGVITLLWWVGRNILGV